MSNYWLERTRKIPVTAFPLLAALAVGLGIPPGGVGQQPATKVLQNAKTMQQVMQKKGAPPPAKQAPPAGQPKPETELSSTSSFAGRRDPFKLPPPPGKGGAEGIPEGAPSGPGGPLPPGTRGLIISQLRLEGTVREETSNIMIALVTNETKRAYFLRNNDAVYNGLVSKITPDAIYFQENVLDSNGRVSTQEVVKRMGPAAGEGR